MRDSEIAHSALEKSKDKKKARQQVLDITSSALYEKHVLSNFERVLLLGVFYLPGGVCQIRVSGLKGGIIMFGE